MGLFTGWLLCSDYDNTLTRSGVVPEGNLEAIRAFRAEGGLFAIASGRTTNSVLQFDPLFSADGYVIANNGSILYETATGEILRQAPLENWEDALQTALELCGAGLQSYGIYRAREGYYLHPGDALPGPEAEQSGPVTKLVFNLETEQQKQALRTGARRLLGSRYAYNSASSRNFEIMSPESGKGVFALELKRRLGAHTLVGVGDFENDIDLLKAADYAFAPSTAMEAARRAATEVLAAAPEGIFPALVERLRTIAREKR